MKRVKRYLVVMIALGLIISIAMIIPASAQTSSGDVKVDSNEFIFSTIDYAGNITGIQIFNWLSLNGDGTVEVKEVKTLDGDTSYQGVKGFTKPSVEGDMIVWPSMKVDGPESVIATTVLSDSMVDEAKMTIPLSVKFRYWFDGQPITDPGTITGKTGRFKMEVTFKNESKELTEVEYEDPTTGEMVTTEVETYLPMGIQPYDWYFDNSIFYNLETDPTGLVIQFPDLYSAGWTIPLFPPATNESHTIWVAADVKNFQLPPLTLGVAFVFPESNQVDPFVFIKPGMQQIYDGVKQLAEGVGTPETADTLLYGITAVNDGLQQMGAGLPDAVSSINNDMIPGVDQMVTGIGSPTTANTLLWGGSQITAGLQDMKTGLGDATTDATLIYAINAMIVGLQDIYDGLDTQLIPGIYAVMLGLVSGDPSDPGILEGLQAMSAGLGGIGQTGTIIDTLNWIQMSCDITNPPGTGLSGILSQYIGLLTPGAPGSYYDIVNGWTEPPTPNYQINTTEKGIVLGYFDNIRNDLSTAMLAVPPALPGVGFIDGALQTIIPGLQAMKAGADDSITGITTLMYPGLQLIYAGLIDIRDGIGSASTVDTLLYAAAGIQLGLDQFKEGIGDAAIPTTLLGGMAAIQGGLYSIQAGLSTGNLSDPGIKEGLILISEGLSEAVTGIGSPSTADTLLYGTTAVEEGLVQVGDGMGALESGLAGFVEGFAESDAQLAAIAMRGEEFDHLLGRAEDADCSVRFVYQMTPTYNYKSGSTTSWIVAIVLSVIIALALAAGGIMLARRGSV